MSAWAVLWVITWSAFIGWTLWLFRKRGVWRDRGSAVSAGVKWFAPTMWVGLSAISLHFSGRGPQDPKYWANAAGVVFYYLPMCLWGGYYWGVFMDYAIGQPLSRRSRRWSRGRGALAMDVFRSLTAFFRKGTPDFKPLEKKILDGVIAQLDAERAGKLSERIARINLVQRLDGGREVNVYEMKNGKPVIDSSLRLSGAEGEMVLAEFSLTAALGARNDGKVWLVDGRFFSLEFRDPTEHMLDDRLAEIQVRLAS